MGITFPLASPLQTIGKSQPACKPGSVRVAPRRPFIWGAHCWTPLATNPGGNEETHSPAAVSGRGLRRPYLVLLPAGFAMPRLLPAARCALTAPFHPYNGQAVAVCFLWHFPWGHPRRMLSGAVFQWSPDFPQQAYRPQRSSGRLTVSNKAIRGLCVKYRLISNLPHIYKNWIAYRVLQEKCIFITE